MTAFAEFVQSICSKQRPLILFLDDLQWADKTSVELLSTLASCKIEGFMLLGACRGNEVAIHDPLAVTFRELEENKGVNITNISLHNFGKGDVQSMLSEYFPCCNDDLKKVTELVYEQTEGNVFYIVHLLKLYQEQGALSKRSKGDEAKQENWHWDVELMPNLKRNLSDVMRKALTDLPEDVRVVLQTASCLGGTFHERHLDLILDETSYDVPGSLQVAAKKHLISYSSLKGRLTHDRLQEAAYMLIPTDQRAGVHASIGLGLLEKLPSSELDDCLFLVVNQLGSGLDEIQDPQDRARLAELCLRAGEKAVASSAFATASEYLDLGIKSLESASPHNWRTHYGLSLALFNAAAEVEYCNGRFDKINSHVEQVFEHARCFEERYSPI